MKFTPSSPILLIYHRKMENMVNFKFLDCSLKYLRFFLDSLNRIYLKMIIFLIFEFMIGPVLIFNYISTIKKILNILKNSKEYKAYLGLKIKLIVKCTH